MIENLNMFLYFFSFNYLLIFKMIMQNLYYLLLSQLDGQLQPVQMHAVTVLEGRPGGIVVQQHLELVR